jgi:hypothetical protein
MPVESKTKGWFGGRRPTNGSNTKVLTAASMRLNLDSRKQARQMRALRQGWQLEAFAYRASVGELRYAVNFLANCASRMRIFPAAYPLGGETDSPIALADLAEEEQVPADILAACKQAMIDLGNGRLATANLMRNLSTNLTVAGEGYLLGQEDPSSGKQSWGVRSISEIVVYDDQWKLREVPLDPQGILGWETLDPEHTVISRMWISDPQFRVLADSPLKPLCDDLESLLILRRAIRATGRSRLAGRGILLMPSEMSIVTPSDDDDHPDTDPFMGPLIESMTTPISDEGVAASVVPILVRGPGEMLDKVRLLEMAMSFDEMGSKTREELIGIVATGLDLPKEVITGIADLNHWSAWSVDDNTFRHHVEPHVISDVDCLTGAYLRPYIEACPIDPAIIAAWAQRLLVWYDPTDLVTHPDQTADAINLHDRLVISDATLLRVAGFSPEDAPEPDEYMARLISKQRQWPANLTMGVIHDIDPELTIPPMAGPPALPGIKPSGVDTGPTPALAAPGTSPAPESPPTAPSTPATPSAPPPPKPTLPGPPPAPVTAAAIVVSPRSARLSRKLSAIDSDLRARLTTAANAAMLRQLEKVGGRLRSKVSKSEDLRTKIAMTRNEQVAQVLGRETVVSALGMSAGELMSNDWATFKAQFLDWTEAAQTQALRVAAQLAGLDEAGATASAATAMAGGRQEAWALLSDALTAISHDVLYDPSPGAEADTFDPNTLVPTGTIRAALGVAGGMDPTAFAPSGTGLATVDPGVVVGQIGTGDTISSFLSGEGQSIAGYEWVHGPSLNPFEPHEDLDGTEFGSFDDAALANTGDWPPNAYFIPGDHRGCSCDFMPLYADSATDEADSSASPTEEDPDA